MAYLGTALLLVTCLLMMTACGNGRDTNDTTDSSSGTGTVDVVVAPPVDYIGMKIGDLREVAGPPRGRLKTGKRIVFVYDGMELISSNGKTVTEVKYTND